MADYNFYARNGKKIFNDYGKLIKNFYKLYNNTKTPYYCTYFSVSVGNSIDLIESGKIGSDEIIGLPSNYRWNKIENFPIYLKDTLDFNIKTDNENYYFKVYETSAVIHSQIGLIPIPGDLVIIPYPYDNTKYLTFIVDTDFDKNIPIKEDFYQIKLITEDFNLDDLKEQITGLYKYIDIFNKIYEEKIAENIEYGLNKYWHLKQEIKEKEYFAYPALLIEEE